MRKAISTLFAQVWGWAFVLALTTAASTNVQAQQCSLTCQDLLSVAMDQDCSVELTPSMVLESSNCPGDKQVQVKIGNTWQPSSGTANFVLTSAHVGTLLKVRVRHLASGNFCEMKNGVMPFDNLKPELTCSDLYVPCAIQDASPFGILCSSKSKCVGYDADDVIPYVDDNCDAEIGTWLDKDNKKTSDPCKAVKIVGLTWVDTWVSADCEDSHDGTPIDGYIVRNWTAVDKYGNINACTQYIYFVRASFENLHLPDDVTLDCDKGGVDVSPKETGEPTLYWAVGDITCEIPVADAKYCKMAVTHEDLVLNVCDGTKKILREWTIVDWCYDYYEGQIPSDYYPFLHGNVIKYTQLIKIIDTEGPEVVDTPTWGFPKDITVGTDAYKCCATVDLPDFIVTDGCSRVHSASAEIEVWNTWNADYDYGYASVPGTLSTFAGNNLWDCDTLAKFGKTPCLPITEGGAHRVTLKFTDNCGNHSEYTYFLTVQDLTPPVNICRTKTDVSLGADGQIWVPAESFDEGSYDNCGPVYFKVKRMVDGPCDSDTAADQFDDSVGFCCADCGKEIMVVLRVYDVKPAAGKVKDSDYEGHYNDCMVTVNVVDKLRPVCTAPANVTVSCEEFDPTFWSYGAATGYDNCGNVEVTEGTADYSKFDKLCNRGDIIRNWTVKEKDCGGLTSKCTQKITVRYYEDYTVCFPVDNHVTECNGEADFGLPEFDGEDCELLAHSFEDLTYTVTDGACYKIERTWRVINWCVYSSDDYCVFIPKEYDGHAVSNCVSVEDGYAYAFVDYNDNGKFDEKEPHNFGHATCLKYKQVIKITDDNLPTVTPQPVEPCDLSSNDPLLWNASYWWDGTISSHDLCEGEVDVCIKATDPCSGADLAIRYQLFLDLDGNGSMETVVSSNNPPAPGFVNYNNVAANNLNGGTAQQFDHRDVKAGERYSFVLSTEASGKEVTACVRWKDGKTGAIVKPQLPYGKHKVKWFVADKCGNETAAEQTFEVKDCKKPTIVCHNGLSVNIMPTKMISIWASDFVKEKFDNCTPSDQLKIAIRKAGKGEGFPVDDKGNPVAGVTFTCEELGTQPVEVWAIDKAGNADFCETYIIVQDNAGNCGPGTAASVAGILKTEDAKGVEAVSVNLQGSLNGVPNPSYFFNNKSNTSGEYLFSNALPLSMGYDVTPDKDDNVLNGVSTFDLSLISKHLLGQEPLNTPYKMIAADANKSGSITSIDIVELRKLILGISTELPNSNTSWRFVDKTFVFPQPANPFATTFPESRKLGAIATSRLNEDFVSVKVGDVNNNAVANSQQAGEERSAGTVFFDIADAKVEAGDDVTVNFKVADRVAGFQFTMNFEGLQVAEVVPGAKMSTDNFAVFAQQGAITTSVDGEGNEFAIRFRATKSGDLSKLIKVTSNITAAHAYDAAGQSYDVAFRFNGANGSVVAGAGFELLQNTPNPVKNVTNITFNLPEATEATLKVTNAEGRIVKVVTQEFAKGLNTVSFNRGDLKAGILFYQLDTPTNSAVKKMIVVE